MSPLVQFILQEAPKVIGLIQERYAANNPTLPPLTAEQVVAAFEEAFTSTIAKDEMIKATLAQ